MADALEIQVADAVVAQINSQTWSETFRAERSYADIDAELTELDVLRVEVVLPEEWDQYDLDTRGSDEAQLTLTIAIRKRFGTEQQNQRLSGALRSEVDRLYTLAVDMARHFTTRAPTSLEAEWVQTTVQHYDRQKLATEQTFAAVIELQYKLQRTL